jgi:hypothetical protein
MAVQTSAAVGNGSATGETGTVYVSMHLLHALRGA